MNENQKQDPFHCHARCCPCETHEGEEVSTITRRGILGGATMAGLERGKGDRRGKGDFTDFKKTDAGKQGRSPVSIPVGWHYTTIVPAPRLRGCDACGCTTDSANGPSA